jgi:orotate phosphoribosyltransferase
MWDKKELIRRFYENNIILQKGPNYPEGFLLKSGKQTDIYINLRDLLKNPALFGYAMYAFTELINKSFKTSYYATILGIPTMGAVMAPIVAYKKCWPLAVIRTRQKDHGVGKSIEGELREHLIIIDDVITTGLSIRENLEKHILPVYKLKFGDKSEPKIRVFVLIDREEHDFDNVQSLATLSEIKEFN